MIDTVYIIAAVVVVALGAAIIYANRLRLDADGDGAVTLKDAGVIVDKVEDKVEAFVEEAKERVERIQEEVADVAVAVKAVAKQAKGVAKAAQGKARTGRKKKK